MKDLLRTDGQGRWGFQGGHARVPNLRSVQTPFNVLNAYCEIGIVYCSCGRNVESSQRPKESENNNYDVSSIRGYAIKKKSSRGATHGPSERQRVYF